jgi:two-component system sensor histidine kinase HydH
LLRDHGVIGSVDVPIHGRTRPLGVLGAHTAEPGRFTEDDVHFVEAVANILAGALERRSHLERDRERYEQRVEQMMALGQVAAGVAHELRNPLTAINGLVQVNLRKMTSQGVPSEDLGVIDHEIRRMERSLQIFLDFARPVEPNRRRLVIAPIVEQVSALIAGRARKQNVSFRFLQPDAPVWVEADHDQIEQLLLNMILNALDAMPDGGAVEIDLRPPRESWVELYVRDTGPGIASHILPKVFEAFVSSKETGVGLGLPVSHRIAEDHGGALSAYNLPGGGACFLLRLPALASRR